MTIGERIQILRKNNGLSQEELAQKLLVSRQTVSQWETDQTVPSVDNIYRLKEVLNVSFDELMSDEKAEKEETEEKTEEEKPLEEYENTPEWDELKFALNCASNFDIKKIALLIIPLLALALFDIYMENYGATFGCVITLSAMVLVWVFGVLNTRKKLKNLFLKNGEKEVQQYKVYHDRLEVICLNNGELVSLNVLKRDDIVAFYENEKYYVFQAKNQLFSICKNLVNKDSYFYSFIYKNKEPLKKTNPVKKILSVVLIIASVLSPFIGTMIESNHSDYFDNIVGANAWMLWLFIPIPLACVFYGMYLKKKGYKSKATTVIGVCMIAALLVAGSSSNYSDYDYTDIDKLTMWEDEIGFDFPDKGEVVTLEDFDMEEDSSEYYETTVVRLSDKDAENFTEKILQSDKWVTEFPDNIELYSAYDSFFDYHLLYNKTTGQINEAPEKSGEYTFVYFKYLESDKVLVVEKYTMHLNIA